ncbi:MAG: PIN domain-containing protein [Candidatus Aminicenantes bacterium]|nr:PIN domain-containing protein [Candidatus Aminicenantes bacterium]
MTVLIALNIFIDVFQKRIPHYDQSSLVLTKVINKELTGYIAGHSVTTLYYLICKFLDREKALELIDWLLTHFEIESAEKEDFMQARTFDMKDFEDAVAAGCAQKVSCDYIITRNIKDFKKSPIPAITAVKFIEKF